MKLRTFFWKTHRKVQEDQTQNFAILYILIPVLVQDHGELKFVKHMKLKEISDSYGVKTKETPTIQRKI